MNKWELFLKEKGYTNETFAALEADKMAQLNSEYQTKLVSEVEAQITEKTSKEDVSTIVKAAIDALPVSVTKAQYDDVVAKLVKQGETLQEMKGKGDLQGARDGIGSAFKALMTAEKVSEIREKQGSGLSTTTKAAGTILVSTNTTGRVARFERDGERSKPARRNPFILELVNVSTTTAAVVTYVERVAPGGAPGMTAEGAVKPLIDFDYIERTAAVKKMTARAKMSKEMMEDVDGFVADTEDELTERLGLLFDAQLLSGDGTGNNLSGLETNATAFAAGSLANAIESANNFDVLRVALNQVSLNNFDATYILMNPSDVTAMDLTKGSDNHYIMPPFSTSDGTIIKGIRIVENNGVTADDFIVGDLSKYKVKVREDLNINYGHSGDDFEKNLLTALCEGRATAYISNNYFGAIVKGTFSAARAALETA